MLGCTEVLCFNCSSPNLWQLMLLAKLVFGLDTARMMIKDYPIWDN